MAISQRKRDKLSRAVKRLTKELGYWKSNPKELEPGTNAKNVDRLQKTIAATERHMGA